MKSAINGLLGICLLFLGYELTMKLIEKPVAVSKPPHVTNVTVDFSKPVTDNWLPAVSPKLVTPCIIPKPAVMVVKWWNWPNQQDYSSTNSVIRDVRSHIRPKAGFGPYEGGDDLTQAHENTHEVNSNIRNTMKGVSAFYVLQDRCIVLKNVKKVTMEDVAKACPFHGPAFDQYMVQMRSHYNDTPLYILDETTAYLNGSKSGFETRTKGTWFEIQQSQELLGYAKVMSALIKQREPDYEDQQALDLYLNWIDSEIQTLRVKYADQVRPIDNSIHPHVDVQRPVR